MSTNPPMPPRPAAPLFCSKCGAAVSNTDAFCPKCAAPQGSSTYVPPVVAAAPGMRYAGFWIRFAAWLLDVIILGIAITPIKLALFGALGISSSMGGFGRHSDPAEFVALMAPAIGLSVILSLSASWLYEAFLLSSSKQATVGKMACGLRVVDTYGRRLSFMHATGRHFAKYISGLTLGIGYIMIAFTERKQALHDLIAGTLVLKG